MKQSVIGLRKKLTKEFGFDSNELLFYDDVLYNDNTRKKIKETVEYINSRPNHYKEISHKKNAIKKRVKTLREQYFPKEKRTEGDTHIGSIIKTKILNR
ncbi:hypothetical protein [Wenyingzhuangia sp. IMCC45574]